MKWLYLSMLLPVIAVAGPEQSPYSGQQSRPIKALSASQVKAYLEGQGMGYAKPAELNHYPGPRHVLELAGQLKLSASQLRQTRETERRMKESASALGAQLVELERSLDEAFASGQIDDDSLAGKIMQIAELDGQIRLAHLAAHLEMRRLLSSEQIVLYDQLRGYGSRHSREDHPSHEGAGHSH
ncbi:MAG: hypothetical protein HKO64_00330 [Xanthomonadales bacterium]|nr:hypothetical protein [Gammaproteobacteria bacterium]NNL94041.1 hypothetical protein [Xanthomonadales bacterium]